MQIGITMRAAHHKIHSHAHNKAICSPVRFGLGQDVLIVLLGIDREPPSPGGGRGGGGVVCGVDRSPQPMSKPRFASLEALAYCAVSLARLGGQVL